MTMPPIHVPRQNHHSLMVSTPELARLETERLPETLADALAACRRALDGERQLPLPFRDAAPSVLERATAHLRSRRLLTADCRAALALCREAAEGWTREHGPDSALDAFAGALADIVALAARVDDLLAAEAELARRRRQLADDQV